MKQYKYEAVVGNKEMVGRVEARTLIEAKEKVNRKLRREYGRNARVIVIEEIKW